MNELIEQFAQEQREAFKAAGDKITQVTRHKHIITMDFLPDHDNISILMHSPLANFETKYQNFHKHAFFELVYVYSGCATQYSKNGAVTLPQGSLLLMNTNYYHGLYVASDDDIVFNILISPEVLKGTFLTLVSDNDLFYKFFMDDMFQEEKMGDYILCNSSECPRAVRDLDLLLEEWIQKQDCYQSACTAYLALVFTEIFRKQIVRNLGSSKDKMEGIIRYMQEHIDTINLSDLAAEYHYSNEHMSRVVKSLFGQNFTALLTDLRLDKAVFLMNNTSQSIDSIALQLGFYDRSHFNKVYKKKYGYSPGARVIK